MAKNIVPFSLPFSNDNSEPPVPPQPGLRSFIVYDELPEGCVAFEIKDSESEPHVSQGEFVVVDTADCEPQAGEMYLCAFASPYPNEKSLRVMVALNAERLPGHFVLSPVQPQQLVSLDGKMMGEFRLVDGPYPPQHLEQSLFRGKVVGIYQPDFRRQLLAA